MIPSMTSVIGTGTPPTAGPPESPVVCYQIGGCTFSELSFLSVTKHSYEQLGDCSFKQTTLTEDWIFDSRTATTFRYALDADNWAEYSADTGQWSYSSTDIGYDLLGICANVFGPPLVVQTCTSYSRSTFGLVGYMPDISWIVMKNDCIPSVAV